MASAFFAAIGLGGFFATASLKYGKTPPSFFFVESLSYQENCPVGPHLSVRYYCEIPEDFDLSIVCEFDGEELWGSGTSGKIVGYNRGLKKEVGQLGTIHGPLFGVPTTDEEHEVRLLIESGERFEVDGETEIEIYSFNDPLGRDTRLYIKIQ